MEEPKITVVQDLYTSSDGRESIKYTATYLDPNDPRNDIIEEQANSAAQALDRLYEVLEQRRGISRDTLPQPRLL
jgi:hypothetical protein